MKKIALYVTAGVLSVMLMACSKEQNSGVSENTTEGNSKKEQVEMQLANPWTTSDEAGVYEATNLPIKAPAEATNVVYSYQEDSKLAQVTYEYESSNWTLRMQKADELVDLSGMYYLWDWQEKGTVAGNEAMLYNYADSEEIASVENTDYVRVVNWYDETTQIAYSLSVTGGDLNGMDLQVYAENIYALITQ